MSPVGGRLSNFVEGWKRITNDPYVLSIVAKGYRLRFTSPPLLRQIPWEIRSPQYPKEVFGMREQITIMLQKNAITEVPPDSPGFYSNVFLVRKASGGWRPVIDLKNLNAHIHAPHFRMFTTSSVLSSVEKGDYAFKIDLQDAYFHVPIHPSSRKYLRFAFENKVYQFRVLPFGLNTAPQVFTRLGHTVTAYLHRQGVSVIPYLDDWLVHHPDRQILLRHQALLIDTLDLVGFILNRKKSRAGPYSGSPVPWNSLASGHRESFTHRVQGWGDSRLRAPSILPQGTRLFSSVPSYGFTQLGLGSYPSGSFVPETPSTSFSCVRSDKPVYATAQIRPCGPCQPTAALAGPTFSYLRNPDPPLSGGLHNLHGRLQSGLGRSHGRFQGFRFLDPYRPQAPHQLSGAQGGYSRPTALGSSASGPPSHDRHGQFDSGFIYQQAGRDSLPFPATLDCRASPLVRGTRHSSPGETHSRLPELDSRPPISSEPANSDRVVPTPRDRETHLQGLGDTRSRHVCDSVELPPSSVHVSSSGAKSPSGGCSVSRLAGEVNVHVSTLSPAQQGRAEVTVHPCGRGDSRSPLVAVSTVVSTPTTSLCGTPVNSPLPSRSSVPAGPEVHLRRKVIPSARMEALMRHYKAAGFSDEVSRLAAAPRRPSTNRMYDDRWCRFARWAAGQGVDPLNPTAAQVASFLFDLFDTHGLSPQTVKGYRTCIGSVLNRTGKSRVVSHRAISDMIASMELQRPRATPVLPQWDLGVVLEALNKPPYEPLREASFKHLTLKTVFLLAMASAGRRSELHALRFDQNYIQFKPKGAGVTLYFSPEFMRKNQKPNQVNDPWYIPAIPTGKPEFGAPNCPVRALHYYHRYLTEHPELRKDRRRLFVPIKDKTPVRSLVHPPFPGGFALR